ncbi:hypothetical protein IEQ34_018884 [Dendrobium chrysotoxum]|uniref:Uncharacterized protein n=1 Tax=Dendrobium chrysotoxum TaxID=161865 RepID=A0AAV7G631_DENCH|nr:hypothetical protein IEQ34_018884 [Dendrobium chrysotoxum]
MEHGRAAQEQMRMPEACMRRRCIMHGQNNWVKEGRRRVSEDLVFSYKDLYRATNGFRDENLLGNKGYGGVYKGQLPKSKLEMAVKRISHDLRQRMKEFVAKIARIGRL